MKTMNVLDRVVDSLDVETFIMCQNEEEGKNRLSINERSDYFNVLSRD